MSNALDRCRSLLVPLPNAQGIYVRNDDLAKLIALADAVIAKDVDDCEPGVTKVVRKALDALTKESP